MNLELINKRHPCELCGGYGFVLGFDNDQHTCQRCKGDCDDPTFEDGRDCGVEAERARIIKRIEEKQREIDDQLPYVSRLSLGDMYELHGQKYICETLIAELRGEK